MGLNLRDTPCIDAKERVWGVRCGTGWMSGVGQTHSSTSRWDVMRLFWVLGNAVYAAARGHFWTARFGHSMGGGPPVRHMAMARTNADG